MTEAAESRALTPAIGQGQAISIVPKTFDEAWRFANLIAKSNAAPSSFRGKPEDAMVAVMMGLEVGLSPMQAIQNIAVINGRPSLWGDAMVALCMVHPQWGGIEDSFDGATFTSTVTVHRKGMKPVVRRYSQADAVKSKLWGKQGPWTTDPARMCFNRARAFALRDAFADALRGLSSAEEQRDVIEITGSHAPVPAEPVVGDSQVDPVEVARRLIEPMQSLEDLASVWASEGMQSTLKVCDPGQRQHIINIKEKHKKALQEAAERAATATDAETRPVGRNDGPDQNSQQNEASAPSTLKKPPLNMNADALLLSLEACHQNDGDGMAWWEQNGEAVKALPKRMADYLEARHVEMFPQPQE